jgi:2-methylcitrate dehydratase PrpD
MHDVTTGLARFVVACGPEQVSELARDEAVRALVNWLGCALGGCLHPAVDRALASSDRAAHHEQATLPGRGERTDLGSAAYAAAVAASLLHYGDTHPSLGIAVAPVVAAALLPLAEARAASGADVLHAFVLGAESACRAAAAGLGETQDPSVACGALGAAAACARLLALDEMQTLRALRRAAHGESDSAPDAASSSSERGLGAAAREGLRAALLAAQETPAETTPFALSSSAASARERDVDWSQGLGAQWWFTASAFHAYPCDAALHAAIETCRQLKTKHGLNPRNIEAAVVRLPPARLAQADAPEPKSAAEARRSAQHAVAAALLDGRVGLRQFEPARLASPRLQALRARVRVEADAAAPDAGGRIEIHLRDGSRADMPMRTHLAAAAQPMDNAALNAKFRVLAAEALATDQAERVLALAWNIAALADIGSLIRATVPQDDIELAELPGSPLLPR